MTLLTDLRQAHGARTRFYLRVDGHKEAFWEDGDIPGPGGEFVGEGPPGAHAVQADTVALWRFDEWGADAHPQDSGPAALHLTQHGSPAVYDGQFSRSRYFNSNTKYCDRDTHANLQLQRFTIGAWVYVDSLTQDSGAKVIYLERTATTDDYSFTLETQGANARLGAKLYFTDTATASAFAASDTTIGWHYLVATWDGTTLTVYLDGASVATATASGKTILYTTSGVKLSVGNLNGGGTKRWNGRIDDVAIYSTAKSAEWIRRTYNGGVGFTRPGLACLEVKGDYADELDMGEMEAAPGALSIELRNIDDPADPTNKYFAKLFAPGRWSTSPALWTWLRRAAFTDYYLGANAAEIVAQHLSGWPSSGEAFIGCETFSYTATASQSLPGTPSETGAKFTGVTKGLYPCFGQDTDYHYSQRTYRHARGDNLAGDATAAQIISSVPAAWIGRRVALYLTVWDEANGKWYAHSDALLFYAGVVGDGISFDPAAGTWRLGVDSIVRALERKVMAESPAGALTNEINLEGTWGRKLALYGFPNGHLTHTLTVTIPAGRYTPEGIVNALNSEIGAATPTDLVTPSLASRMAYFSLPHWTSGKAHVRGIFAMDGGNPTYGNILILDGDSPGETSLILAALGFNPAGVSITVDGTSTYQAGYATAGAITADDLPLAALHPIHKDANAGYAYIQYDEGWWSSQGDFGSTRAFLVSDKCKVHSGTADGAGDAERRLVLAVTGNTGNQFALHFLQPMPEYFGSSRSAWIGYRQDEKPIEFRQAYVQESFSFSLQKLRGPLELLLYPLLSTGTAGTNHSTYDAMPLELGIGLPSALVDVQSFIDMDRRLMARMQDLVTRDVYLIDKPTSWMELFQREAKLGGFFLAWDRGQLRVKSGYEWRTDQALVQLDDSNCLAWPGVDLSAATVINQWEFKVDYDYATDKYHAPVQLADIGSQQKYGTKEVKVEHPGVRLKSGDTGQIVQSLRKAIQPVLELLRDPLQRVTVELSPTLLYQLHVGDVVTYVATARHPDPFGSGAMTCTATALVTSISWTLDRGQRKGQAGLLVFGAFDAASKRPWAGSALVDRTASNAGWDNTNKRLTLVALEFGEAGDYDDGARFASGDYVLILDRNPVDPASLTSSEVWGPIAVASAYETDGAQLLTLAGGTTLTGWDTTHEYVVVPADYADAVAAQRLVNAYQAAVSDAKLNSADAAHRWG